jgi:hypothetical protein
MSGIDVHISVNNIPQMDRHQSDTHRAPIIQQVQNAEIARSQLDQRMRIPNQPDRPEGKIADPGERRRDAWRSRRKKRIGEKKEESGEKRPRGGDRGSIIEIEA